VQCILNGTGQNDGILFFIVVNGANKIETILYPAFIMLLQETVDDGSKLLRLRACGSY
jgi:hypothetical protein